jgi:hypothetical protein
MGCGFGGELAGGLLVGSTTSVSASGAFCFLFEGSVGMSNGVVICGVYVILKVCLIWVLHMWLIWPAVGKPLTQWRAIYALGISISGIVDEMGVILSGKRIWTPMWNWHEMTRFMVKSRIYLDTPLFDVMLIHSQGQLEVQSGHIIPIDISHVA